MTQKHVLLWLMLLLKACVFIIRWFMVVVADSLPVCLRSLSVLLPRHSLSIIWPFIYMAHTLNHHAFNKAFMDLADTNIHKSLQEGLHCSERPGGDYIYFLQKLYVKSQSQSPLVCKVRTQVRRTYYYSPCLYLSQVMWTAETHYC